MHYTTTQTQKRKITILVIIIVIMIIKWIKLVVIARVSRKHEIVNHTKVTILSCRMLWCILHCNSDESCGLHWFHVCFGCCSFSTMLRMRWRRLFEIELLSIKMRTRLNTSHLFRLLLLLLHSHYNNNKYKYNRLLILLVRMAKIQHKEQNIKSIIRPFYRTTKV